MLRRPELRDIPRIMPICIEHYIAVKMVDRCETIELNTCMETLKWFIDEKFFFTMISEEDKQVDGIIVFMMSPSLFDKRHKKATEILWYADNPKTFIKLFEAVDFEGCQSIHVGLPGDSNVRKFLAKRGFKETAITMSKELSNV